MARIRISLWALLIFMVATIACGEEEPTVTIEESTFPVGDAPQVVVDIFNGKVIVDGSGPEGTVDVETTVYDTGYTIYRPTQDDEGVVMIQARDGRGPGFRYLIGDAPQTDVIVRVPPGAQVSVRSLNGDVEISGLREAGSVNLDSGPVRIDDVQGVFTVMTNYDDVSITRFSGEITIETTNGDVELEGRFAAGSRNRIETEEGSIMVTLAGDAGIALDAMATGGTVSNSVSIAVSKTDRAELVGVIGNGEAELVIRAEQGSVTIE